MDPVWSIFTHKWTRCSHCVILGLEWVMLLYIAQVGFWIEHPIQMRLSNFVKFWILVNGT